MIYTTLPQTSISVSKICLGTMTFGEQNSLKDAHDQLECAYDHGINFLDTAELYAVPSTQENNGLTEKYIGEWLKTSSNRQKYIVATKVTGPSPNLRYISQNLGFSKLRILEAIEGSLKRLQTDYVDLYQLHWPERKANFFGKLGYEIDQTDSWQDNIADIVNTIGELLSQGKIRAWGLSNETPWGTMRFIYEADKAGIQRPSTVQNPYSLINRTFEIGLSEICHRENIGCLPYSPLAMGMLTGKYHSNYEDENARLNKFKYFNRYLHPNIKVVVKKYIDFFKEFSELQINTTLAALAFVNQQSFVTSNIIGATSLKQLEENISSIEFYDRLPNSFFEGIENIHRFHSNPAP